jgi:2-polyprenyl-3-methyl-5-hydroxy-6-metoxy-1,4-benzoquinol methylase
LCTEILKNLKDKKTFLDLGCGTGFYSQFISSKGYKTYSLDFSDKALELTNQKCNYVNIPIKCDILNDFPANISKVDVIFMDGLLEHFEFNDQSKILYKCKKILNDNGVVISLTPYKYHFYQIFRYFIMKNINEEGMTVKKYKKVLSNNFNNFQILKIIFFPVFIDVPLFARIMPMHLLAICKK